MKELERKERREKMLKTVDGFAVNLTNYDSLRGALYDAMVDIERAEAYQEGYRDALKNIEQLVHDFRIGVRS